MLAKHRAGLYLLLSVGILHFRPQASAIELDRVSLENGMLSVPSTVKVEDGRFDLVVHLHGATKVVEENLAITHPKAVWVTLTLPGLSSVYRRHFQDPKVFNALLEEVGHHLTLRKLAPEPKLQHLTVTSFSAGFGGVRELLKQPANFDRIDSLVMADSIYAGFIGKVSDRILNPEHLRPFLNFARKAAAGEKQMLVSYTELHTPEYASTRETAEYLIRALGGSSRLGQTVYDDDMVERSRCSIGRFMAIGFEGEMGEDHMKHLRQMRIFLHEVNTMREPK